MSRARLAFPSALLVLAAAFLTGCGNGSATASAGASSTSSAAETDADADKGAGKGAEQSGTPETVECPADATAVDLPADFPAPLPAGTVVVAVEHRAAEMTVVTGVVPKAEAAVLKELQAAYKAPEWALTQGETEERDAESNFSGNDVRGRWGIRALEDCSGSATRIDIVVQKT